MRLYKVELIVADGMDSDDISNTVMDTIQDALEAQSIQIIDYDDKRLYCTEYLLADKKDPD
jgi:hypothetical protein